VTLDALATLRRLVAIPSVNPMGHDVSGPEFGEARLTEYLESLFDRLGLEHCRDPVHPGRDNLVARLDGDVPCDRGGSLVLLGVHQDTVPVDGMTIEPFAARVEGGRVFGRGACDVKGGMAAVLAAVARLAGERPRGMPTVIVACTVNEEHGFSGARALARWCGPSGGGLLPRAPDAAVVAEPTELNVVVAHKGVARWKCHAKGRAAHGARPDAGANAIHAMAHLLVAIEHYAAEILGPATMNVGTIQGGSSVNTVPERCTIEIDRRLLPGEDPDDARGRLIEFVDGRATDRLPAGTSVEHEPLNLRGRALSDECNGPLADRLLRSIEQVAAEPRKIRVPYATNAALYAAAGVPSVVFGPGSVKQAHTADEWIEVESLRQATEIFGRFVREFS